MTRPCSHGVCIVRGPSHVGYAWEASSRVVRLRVEEGWFRSPEGVAQRSVGIGLFGLGCGRATVPPAHDLMSRNLRFKKPAMPGPALASSGPSLSSAASDGTVGTEIQGVGAQRYDRVLPCRDENGCHRRFWMRRSRSLRSRADLAPEFRPIPSSTSCRTLRTFCG